MTVPEPLTVSQLTLRLKRHVEDRFPAVLVVGETSNVTRAGSGHLYFTLKDDAAQLRSVMWRIPAGRLRFELVDGLEVVAFGRLEVYPPRGGYQLVVETLEPLGVGPLELAFRQLHDRLAAEGLFDAARKRPLPRFPRRVAIVTSPAGAALCDVLQVAVRRWPAIDVVVVPVPVQGAGAAPRIARGIAVAARLPGVDVILTGRGGGSLEDLWAFNEEVVARAVAASPVPVVSAVGHEVDTSICDLVADRRALTPSEAAELVFPSADEVRSELVRCRGRLVDCVRRRLDARRGRLDSLATRPALARPGDRIDELRRRIAELENRLRRGTAGRLEASRRGLAAAAASLDALSPLRVLERGYSLTERSDGRLVRAPGDVVVGDVVVTRLARGRITSRVERAERIGDAGDAGDGPRAGEFRAAEPSPEARDRGTER